MLDLYFEVDPPLSAVRRFLKEVEDDLIEETEVATYNATIAQVRTRARRTIAQRLKINQKLVNARAVLNKATRRFPSARYALGTLFHVPARYLNPTQLKAGVRYRRQSGERRVKPGTFIVPGSSLPNIGASGRAAARRFVFERAGKDRLPIKSVGVRIDRLVLVAFTRAARQILPKAERIFVQQFEFRARRAIERYLKPRGPRRRRR